MRALAMLGEPFYARAQSALTPPASVIIRSKAVDFIDAVTRGFSDVALIDPMLAERDRRIRDSLSRAHLGTVLYIRLTPEYAQASVEMIRELGSGDIVTYGYNDDPMTFADILRRQSRASRGQMLLHALAPQIAAMPLGVRRGIDRISVHGHRIDSVERLATLCGVTRGTLFRIFKTVGIVSTSGFVNGLTFLRSYEVLVDESLTMLDIARAIGLSSERSLQRQAVTVTGISLRDIRVPVSIEYLTARIAAVLTAT